MSILWAYEEDDWTLQKATIESGKEAVQQAKEAAKKYNEKQSTKALEFRMLWTRRHHFYSDEYMQKILELLGEVEKKWKLIETVRSDILRPDTFDATD